MAESLISSPEAPLLGELSSDSETERLSRQPLYFLLMHFYQPLVQRPQAVPPLGGRDDFYLAAEAADPAVELVADSDGDVEMEMLLPFRHEDGRSTEALPHG